MSNYWAKRSATTQERLTEKNVRQTQAQLRKYYLSTMERILGQFQLTYNKVLSSIEEDREPTPADLYKLDTYWQLQGQLRDELTKLGNRQAAIMSKNFMNEFFVIYNALALKGETQIFSTIDTQLAEQIINQIWCADGKSWSQRIWGNTEKLQQTLNDNLVHCLITGKKTTELKQILQKDFDVSYRRAEMLVRTEMAHIQTEAAKKRYEDYGLKEYEILGNDDDSCGNHSVDCHEMDGKKFLYAEMTVGKNAPPFHPNCKCCIVPVVE